MKFLNISGIVLSVVLFITAIALMEAVSSAYWSNYDFNSYNSYGNNSSYREMVFVSGVVLLLFTLFFSGLFIINLVKVKTTTTKVLTIIGLSLSLIYLLVNFAILAGEGDREIAGAWCFYAMVTLAFSIVFLVQTVKYENRKKLPPNNKEDLIDLDEMFD